MKAMKLTVAAAVVALSGLAAFGEKADEDWLQQTNGLAKAAAVKASDKLPDVFIMGDSISLGYTPFVQKKLAGEANVTRVPGNCGPSQFYLAEMKAWLGDRHYAVIHVNFGIWDNHYIKGDAGGMGLYWGREITEALPPVAKGTAIRDLGFRIRTPVDVYAKNLRTILAFVKTHADKVVFGLTTPLKSWQGDDRCGRIRCYNEIACAICREMGVAVDDLYAVAERHLDDQGDGCHFGAKGCDALADAVVESVRAALKEPPPPKKD